jgi:hypothetical protein
VVERSLWWWRAVASCGGALLWWWSVVASCGGALRVADPGRGVGAADPASAGGGAANPTSSGGGSASMGSMDLWTRVFFFCVCLIYFEGGHLSVFKNVNLYGHCFGGGTPYPPLLDSLRKSLG